MYPSYDEIFKYSEILNPISSKTLFLAGKLAEINPKKTILDLGSGKGYPSLLWASLFGTKVEGYELNKNFVNFSNSKAELLNLSHLVRYTYGDIKELKLSKRYEVVCFLGLGATEIYGSMKKALDNFERMLKDDGFLIFGEPVWLSKPVPQDVQDALQTPENKFLTKEKVERCFWKNRFKILGSFTSSEEDWEFYIHPINVAMLELIEEKPELATVCKKVIDNFEAEYKAAGKYWEMTLWNVKK